LKNVTQINQKHTELIHLFILDDIYVCHRKFTFLNQKHKLFKCKGFWVTLRSHQIWWTGCCPRFGQGQSGGNWRLHIFTGLQWAPL